MQDINVYYDTCETIDRPSVRERASDAINEMDRVASTHRWSIKKQFGQELKDFPPHRWLKKKQLLWLAELLQIIMTGNQQE